MTAPSSFNAPGPTDPGEGRDLPETDNEAENRPQSREWVLEAPWPRPPLSLNVRQHWAVQNRLKHQVASDVCYLALAAKLPRGLDRVHIALHWQPRIKRRRDDDNPMATLKAAVDALVRYGLVPDDDSEHVTRSCVIEPLGPTSRVWITITEAK